MKSLDDYIKPYSKALIRLMRSQVTSDSPVWSDILTYEEDIQDYLSVLGLELIVKSEDGFAYLRQIVDEDGHTIGITPRRKLSFENSVILLILREKLEEFNRDPTHELTKACALSLEEIRKEIAPLLPPELDENKMKKEMEKHLKSLAELGYVKENKGFGKEGIYIINQIVKERITLEVLHDYKQKLENDVKSLQLK